MIPKSANPKRIVENAQIFDFEISQEDMDEVSQCRGVWVSVSADVQLDDLDEYLVTDWDVVGAD